MSEENKKEFALENVITTAIQIPGVKVDRRKFLSETFSAEKYSIQDILDIGTIQAEVSQEDLERISNKLIIKRTSQSSLASFAAGIPGGLAMAATVPADLLQFFGMALRLAQELAYLYGTEDLWKDGQIDDEKVQSQLLLYCGVMFGVSGAVSGVRVLSTQIAKTTLKKLPQKALTKTFWYPMLKQIGKAIGVKVTKTTVAQGISKAIPVIGGVISGGLNFASMIPMANRLRSALESANFGYTEEELENDIQIIETIDFDSSDEDIEEIDVKTKIIKGGKKVGASLSGVFGKKKAETTNSNEDVYEALEKLAKLKDMGVITQEEFETKKAELLSKI